MDSPITFNQIKNAENCTSNAKKLVVKKYTNGPESQEWGSQSLF